jgi:hypothetical protein
MGLKVTPPRPLPPPLLLSAPPPHRRTWRRASSPVAIQHGGATRVSPDVPRLPDLDVRRGEIRDTDTNAITHPLTIQPAISR